MYNREMYVSGDPGAPPLPSPPSPPLIHLVDIENRLIIIVKPLEPLYKGQVGGGSFVPYTVEPLYKGQVGDVSFVPYAVEPLYKRQVGDGSFVPYAVEPLYKGQVGDWSFVVELLYKGTGHCPVMWRFSEITTCPLFRGFRHVFFLECPLSEVPHL